MAELNTGAVLTLANDKKVIVVSDRSEDCSNCYFHSGKACTIPSQKFKDKTFIGVFSCAHKIGIYAHFEILEGGL